jgi:hypothetical protein
VVAMAANPVRIMSASVFPDPLLARVAQDVDTACAGNPQQAPNG